MNIVDLTETITNDPATQLWLSESPDSYRLAIKKLHTAEPNSSLIWAIAHILVDLVKYGAMDGIYIPPFEDYWWAKPLKEALDKDGVPTYRYVSGQFIR